MLLDSGKTRVGLNAAELLLKKKSDAQILVVVPTQVLKDQWEEEIAKRFLFTCYVEIINTVVTQTPKVDLLILDEAHKYCTEHLSQIFECVEYEMILCLTGTLERLDGKEEIVKQYAPVCDRVTMEEAISNSWVSQVKNYLVLLDVDLTDYNKANQKFNAAFAAFDYNFNTAMSALQDWKFRNTYAKQLGISPKEVMALAAEFMRYLQLRKKFIADHPKKIEVCRKILDARKDKKCITFSSTIKNAEKIGNGYVMHSKQSKKDNSAIIDMFNQASTGIIHTSKAADEGVNLQGLSVGIIMSIDSSKIRKTQRVGRVCRFEPGKQAEMFTLVLRGTQEVKWFTNSNTTDVITINEKQLDRILAGEDISTRPRELNEFENYRF